MRLFYNIGVRIYYLLALILSIWKPKAALWVKGRNDWRKKLEGKFKVNDKVIWFHCASLGEFEQGRPVMETVRENFPDKKILLSFFSPSGYEKRKNYTMVDHVCYLPLDTRPNAKDFLNLVPVEKAFFIKYEFWFYFLYALKIRKIPTYLISGHFRHDQLFFKWYGGWYRKFLFHFTHIFVQHTSSADLLTKYGITNISVAGDTRFDRVYAIAKNNKSWKSLNSFSEKHPVIIAGSTWELDERIILEVYEHFRGMINLILAPHEPNIKSIERIRNLFPDCTNYSDLSENETITTSVIIVDTMGHLSSLYQYGDIAYIGGGFGKGIHNILEASASGLPVLFGPNYKNFQEAFELVNLGGAHSLRNSNEAIVILDTLLADKNELSRQSLISKKYTLEKKGATKIILEHIFKS
jgi:3-deoxy-D-manno-octulosonic-acid transferase